LEIPGGGAEAAERHHAVARLSWAGVVVASVALSWLLGSAASRGQGVYPFLAALLQSDTHVFFAALS